MPGLHLGTENEGLGWADGEIDNYGQGWGPTSWAEDGAAGVAVVSRFRGREDPVTVTSTVCRWKTACVCGIVQAGDAHRPTLGNIERIKEH